MYGFLNSMRKKIGRSTGNLTSVSEPLNTSHRALSRSLSSLSLQNVSASDSMSDLKTKHSKIDDSMIEQTYDMYKKAEASNFKLAKNKLILECLREVADNADRKLTQDTAKKLREIINKWDIERYLRLPSNDSGPGMRLLGIDNACDAKLSTMEKIRIQNCVEVKLQEKIQRILNIYQEEGFNVEEELHRAENGHRDEFLSKCGLKQESTSIQNIGELIQNYHAKIKNCYEQLTHWFQLKAETEASLMQQSNKFKLEAKITQLKTQLNELLATTKMYTEIPITAEAFHKLNSELDNIINSIDREIQEKKELKKQYDALKGTEFDIIVKKYKELSTAVDKKKKILEKL